MKKKIKRLLSALTACAVSAAVMAALPVNAAADIKIPAVTGDRIVGLSAGDEYFIDHIKETKHGAYYDVWKEDESGDISLDLNKGNLSFDCSWENTKRAEFLVGRVSSIDFEDYKKYYIKYSADIESKGGYGLGASFSCVDEASLQPAEVRILEAYSGDEYQDYEFLKAIKVGGVKYNVYRTTGVYNDISVREIYVMRDSELVGEAHSGGDINVKEIFDQLKDTEGLRLAETKTPQLYVEGTGKSGSVSVTKNEAVFSTVQNDINVTNSDKGGGYVYYDGLKYSFWQDESVSNGRMTFKKNGSAVGTYDNRNDESDCLFKKGLQDIKGLTFDKCEKLSVDYDVAVKAENTYAAGVYGWLSEPMTELYVVQFRNGNSFLNNAELIDTVEIDGVKYDLYKKRIILDSFQSKEIIQYWSVSRVASGNSPYEGKGSVDLLKHLRAWKDAGLKIGNITEVAAFAETFGKGKGEFTIGNVDIAVKSSDDKNDIVLKGPNADDTYCGKDEYKYSSGQYNGTCTIRSDGTVIGKCFHEHDSDVYFFDKGKEFEADKEISADGEGMLKLSYNADVSVDGAYCISAEGIMRGENDEPYICYHIYDSANIINEPIDSEYLGKFIIGEKIYKLYVVHSSFRYKNGGRCIDDYYSICTEETGNYTNVNGKINVLDHVETWKRAGLVTGAVKNAYLNVDILGMGNGEVVLNSCEVDTGEKESEKYTTEDIELFKSFLLGKECELDGKDFDINKDGVWDTFDLIELRNLVTE